MGRGWLLLFLSSGCGFKAQLSLDASIGDAHDAREIDAPDGPTVAPFCDETDTSLRACLAFENDTTDGSLYHHDAHATGTSFMPGHAGGKAIVTGPASNVAIFPSTDFDIDLMTLKVWIRPNAPLPTNGARAGIIDSGSRFRIFLQEDGALRCAITSGPDLTTATGVISANTWQRVACTYDGSTLAIYVNGTLVDTLAQTGTIPHSGNGYVVGQNNPSGEQLDGALDELQIFGAIVAP